MTDTRDYSQSKIYKIVCHTTGKIYIGSTTKPLMDRLAKHEYHYKDFLKGKGNRVGSFEILENDNYDIINILAFSCNNSLELRQKEQEVLGNHLDAVNINRAYLSEDEKREDARKNSQRYRQNNPEKARESGKKYRENNLEKKREGNRKSKKKSSDYQNSWGGDLRSYNCCLLKIDPTVFS